METERISNSIMLDPSLIIAQNSIQKTFRTMRSIKKQDPLLKFYYPASLLRMINDRTFSQEKIGKYFLFNAYPAKPNEIGMQLKENSNILLGFEVTGQDIDKHSEIYNNLREDLFYLEEMFGKYTLEILIEEWIFLQEQSWVVSRIKKPFTRFVDAGSLCLQFGGRAVDTMINRTLKRRSDELLNRVDRLRAFGKWIAVGGPSIIGILNNPVTAVIAPLIAGFFLLLDPSDQPERPIRKWR